jgi:hypothetical protein
MARIKDQDSSEQQETEQVAESFVKFIWNFTEEILTSGIQVRYTAGGPSMTIVGFCESSPGPDAIFNSDSIKWPKSDGTFGSIRIFPKIMANTKKRSYNDLNFGSSTTIPDFFIFSRLNDERPYTSGQVFAVVKYWSEKKEEFVHLITGLAELELK